MAAFTGRKVTEKGSIYLLKLIAQALLTKISPK